MVIVTPSWLSSCEEDGELLDVAGFKPVPPSASAASKKPMEPKPIRAAPPIESSSQRFPETSRGLHADKVATPSQHTIKESPTGTHSDVSPTQEAEDDEDEDEVEDEDEERQPTTKAEMLEFLERHSWQLPAKQTLGTLKEAMNECQKAGAPRPRSTRRPQRPPPLAAAAQARRLSLGVAATARARGGTRGQR